MEKPVSVKPSPTKAKPLSSFALFMAQYAYLQRYHATGFIKRSQLGIDDCEWSVDIIEETSTVLVKCRLDVSLAQMRAEKWSEVSRLIAKEELEASYVQETLDKLHASIQQVEGKRSLISKIDKAKQPEAYQIELEKLKELETFLGDPQPFLDQYNGLLDSCKQRVAEHKKTLENLPTIRESQEWEFPFSEIEKVLK
jgi:hypothetical protein